ncbi:MAG TPA: hypothetical protein VGE67_04525 [Haloferula sp.]
MKSKLLTLAFVAIASAASAQVSLKADLVAWGADIPGLSLKSAGKGEPVTALAFRYSKPIRYSGPEVMEIHQDAASAAKATEGSQNTAAIPPELLERRKKEPTLVALAKIPAGSSRVTVLIAPASAGTYQTYVIDDDPTKLPAGKLRILNYSPVKIAMRCNGKEAKEMATKDAFVVSPQEDGQVVYELAYDNQGKWKMQENNLLAVNPKEQVQLIVLKSDADFFTNSDGGRSGFLQKVVLRRPPEDAATP